ncbi:MAG: hypothetical protein AAF688_04655 [Bacteroidota bacterium]
MDVKKIEDIKKEVSKLPLALGGASFETQVLYKKASHRYEFKPSRGYGFFCGAFVIVPFIIIAVVLYQNANQFNYGIIENSWPLLLFVLVWSLATLFLLRTLFRPIVFDKSINRFYKGFFKNKTKDAKHNISMSRIVALQIIGEIVSGKDKSYNSFELNLVLDDASRINVIDHGNLKGVISDADSLSQFLNVPICTAETLNQ